MCVLAEKLLERESLDADEIDLVLNGEELPPVKINGSGTPVKAAAGTQTEGGNTTANAAENTAGKKSAEQPL